MILQMDFNECITRMAHSSAFRIFVRMIFRVCKRGTPPPTMPTSSRPNASQAGSCPSYSKADMNKDKRHTAIQYRIYLSHNSLLIPPATEQLPIECPREISTQFHRISQLGQLMLTEGLLCESCIALWPALSRVQDLSWTIYKTRHFTIITCNQHSRLFVSTSPYLIWDVQSSCNVQKSPSLITLRENLL